VIKTKKQAFQKYILLKTEDFDCDDYDNQNSSDESDNEDNNNGHEGRKR
jgi:hypothetical protein